MASTDKQLKNRELLLVVADAVGGTLNGRTIAQKLLYFSGVVLKQQTGHTAYFYGPYSDEFEAALNRAVLAGEFEERIERIADWYGGPDAVKHIYTLTQTGRDEAAKVAHAHKEAAAKVTETVQQIGKVIPEFRQKTLSAAAKIHLIVSEQKRGLKVDEFRELAKELGWRLSANEITDAIKALEGVGFVRTSVR